MKGFLIEEQDDSNGWVCGRPMNSMPTQSAICLTIYTSQHCLSAYLAPNTQLIVIQTYNQNKDKIIGKSTKKSEL